MTGQGTFQSPIPIHHRLLPFVLMLVSGYAGVMTFFPAGMIACPYIAGEFLPGAPVVVTRATGFIMLAIPLVLLVIAVASLIWVFIGAKLAHVLVAAGVAVSCTLIFILLMSQPRLDHRMFVPGSAYKACGDAL